MPPPRRSTRHHRHLSSARYARYRLKASDAYRARNAARMRTKRAEKRTADELVANELAAAKIELKRLRRENEDLRTREAEREHAAPLLQSPSLVAQVMQVR
jgi:hypothetical protein